MSAPPRTLFLLVDGLGLGARDPAQNPVRSGACPVLESLLDHAAIPIDAGMGVPGIPQSATGQTALLTGVNASQLMGRHVEGFPGPALRKVIRAHNIYDQLARRGYTATFANAYYVTDLADVTNRKIQSVTTVAALQAFGWVRDVSALLANAAVYQDLTRASLRERGYAGPLVTPAESARHLMSVAGQHDFTVFEYFQTDRVGHKGAPEDILRILRLFDEFLAALRTFTSDPRHLMILTSDHGNIEAAGSRGHSANPVPFVAVGNGAKLLRQRVKSVVDVTPAIMALYQAEQPAVRQAGAVPPPGISGDAPAAAV